jgi:hypothetical protein
VEDTRLLACGQHPERLVSVPSERLRAQDGFSRSNGREDGFLVEMVWKRNHYKCRIQHRELLLRG